MARAKKRTYKKPQQYDTTFKTWVRERPAAIVPVLVPGALYQETLDVELIRPTLRVDKVFKIMYRSQDHILHIEFESGVDNTMESRLMAYHAILHHQYHMPVISIIVYPFRVRMAASPWHEMSGEEALVTFRFRTLPLFTLDAEYYLQEHLDCMYPLLPVMKGANRELIERATEELIALYRSDEVTLSQQLIWMELLLERTDTVPEPEKEDIRRRLTMYDPLWEENPKVQRFRAESKAQGELQALQRAVVIVTKARFPELVDLAQQKVTQIQQPDILNYLLEEVSSAPNEEVARWILRPLAA